MVVLRRTVATSSRAIARSRLVPQHGHRAVVRLEGVVEGELVLGEPELLAALLGRPDVLGELDQLLDDRRCLDGAVAVLAQRAVQHLGERPRLDEVPPRAGADLVAQEPAEQLDGEVLLGQLAHVGQELLRQ